MNIDRRFTSLCTNDLITVEVSETAGFLMHLRHMMQKETAMTKKLRMKVIIVSIAHQKNSSSLSCRITDLIGLPFSSKSLFFLYCSDNSWGVIRPRFLLYLYFSLILKSSLVICMLFLRNFWGILTEESGLVASDIEETAD